MGFIYVILFSSNTGILHSCDIFKKSSLDINELPKSPSALIGRELSTYSGTSFNIILFLVFCWGLSKNNFLWNLFSFRRAELYTFVSLEFFRIILILLLLFIFFSSILFSFFQNFL